MAKSKPSVASSRVFFTSDDTALPLPNLIQHQKDSWQEFVETGLGEIGSRLAASVICTSSNVCPRFLPEEFGLDVAVTE